MEDKELRDLAICAVKSNLDKFENDGNNRFIYLSNSLNISIKLWSWNRSRDIKTYKKFLGYNFLWDTKTEWYKELKTEMFMSSKDWKDSLELEGSELFNLVKNAVEEKTLKQQKEQLEKLCNKEQN